MKRINIKYLILTLVLVLSLALSAGCTLLTEVETSPPLSSPATNGTIPTNPEWTITPTESQAPILPSIADVVAKVKPSVVAINTQVVTLDFFNRPSTQEGAGSGWIIDAEGYIVTNNHVVEGANSITITLDDDRTVLAEIVGADPLTDLAVLKIDAVNLLAAAVGDSRKLRVGDWVVAIGNALGRGISATTGIVSSLNVSLDVSAGQTLYGLIQTDAPINPGNSGGPLVNMAGEVIGITSAKLAAVEVEGVGYAISTQEAAPIMEQLITIRYIVRPWLGVGLYTVDQFVIQRYNLAVDKGVLVVNVAPGSPADNAELKPGDVITKLEDQKTSTSNELIRAIHSYKIGQEVKITFWRGETENTASATLTESPSSS
ncbi:S1C family serine protease [Chloroflexota bacterium]